MVGLSSWWAWRCRFEDGYWAEAVGLHNLGGVAVGVRDDSVACCFEGFVVLVVACDDGRISDGWKIKK